MRRPSPGRILAAIGGRLATVRYAVEDVLYVAGRFLRRIPRAIGRGVGAFWSGLGTAMRVRLAAALATVGGLIAVLALAAPTLPCEVPGGEACPPPDNAEDLVPATALAYLHADLDPEGDQFEAAAEAIGHLPGITQELAGDSLALVPGRAGGVLDVALEVAPWFGGEAAIALLPGGPDGGTRQLTLLAIDDPEGAAAFAEELAGGGEAEHRGVEVRGGDGTATAEVDGFLAIGPESAVRELIDVATGAEGSEAIGADEVAVAAREELPNERLGDAFLPRDGVRALIAEEPGPLAYLAPFTFPGATDGVAVSLGAGEGELELAVRSVLDPDRGEAEEGLFAAFTGFEPELPERLPEESLAYAGFGDPQATVEALLAQASADAPGVARGFEGLADQLRRDGAIDIEEQLLPSLGEEAAVAIESRGDPEEGAGADPTPFLELVARGVDPDGARGALARLQGPVAAALGPEFGIRRSAFAELEVEGITAQSLALAPGVELTHAVFDDLAVIATDPLGIERLATGDGGLDGAELFERATDGFPDELSLLVFLDLGGLVSVAERLGLAADPAYAAFAPEIRALRGLGLVVDHDEALLSTDARLLIDPEEAGEAPPPLEPGEPELDPPSSEPLPDVPGFELPPDTPGFEPPPEPEGLRPEGPDSP